MLSKVDREGHPQREDIQITVRGVKLTVRNTMVKVLIEATENNLKWLVSELLNDYNQQPTSEEPAGASCAELMSDTECTIAKDGFQLLVEDLPQSVKYAPSLKAFIVTRNSDKKIKRVLFTVRSRARKTTKKGLPANHLSEATWQKHRATHFADTGAMLDNEEFEHVFAEGAV